MEQEPQTTVSTSRLGKASAGAALAGGLIVCLFVVGIVVLDTKGPDSSALMTGLGWFLLLGMVLQLVGTVAGFAGLFQKDTSKVAPVFGIGCGGLPLALLVLGLVFVALTGGV